MRYLENLLLVLIFLNIAINSNAQCNATANSSIIHSSQCWGDPYLVNISSSYSCLEYRYYFNDSLISIGADCGSGFNYTYPSTANYGSGTYREEYRLFGTCYPQNGDPYPVSTTKTISYSFNCILNPQLVSVTNESGPNCNNSTITINATTNDCNGYYFQAQDVLSDPGAGWGISNFVSSGQSATIQGLPPGTYRIKVYSELGICMLKGSSRSNRWP